jgi:predicted nucleotidyltransferase
VTTVTLDDLRARREEILRIAEKHGAYNLRVFGSVVRGQAGADSDVDFLIEMEEGRTLYDLVGVIQDLEDVLGRKVDVVTEPSLHWFIRDAVLSQARTL